MPPRSSGDEPCFLRAAHVCLLPGRYGLPRTLGRRRQRQAVHLGIASPWTCLPVWSWRGHRERRRGERSSTPMPDRTPRAPTRRSPPPPTRSRISSGAQPPWSSPFAYRRPLQSLRFADRTVRRLVAIAPRYRVVGRRPAWHRLVSRPRKVREGPPRRPGFEPRSRPLIILLVP